MPNPLVEDGEMLGSLTAVVWDNDVSRFYRQRSCWGPVTFTSGTKICIFWHLSTWNQGWQIWTNKNIYQSIFKGEDPEWQSDILGDMLQKNVWHISSTASGSFWHISFESKSRCPTAKVCWLCRILLTEQNMIWCVLKNTTMAKLSSCLSLTSWAHLLVSAAMWSGCECMCVSFSSPENMPEW